MAHCHTSFRSLAKSILLFHLSLCSVFSSAAAQDRRFGSEQAIGHEVEVGSFVADEPAEPEALKIASYNVHGPLLEDVEAVYKVLAAAPELRDTHVWAFQEVRTDESRNFVREMARRLGMYYAHAIARPRGGGWEGLSLLSRLPISDVERLELPHLDTGERLRIGLFATVSAGKQVIRICNVHLPIRMDHAKRAEQMQLIFEKFKVYGATSQILLGDFNTITWSLRKFYHTLLVKQGFKTPFKGHAKTYQRYFFLRLKLDWIYLTGLKVLEQGIEQEIKASDHRPVWATLEVPE